MIGDGGAGVRQLRGRRRLRTRGRPGRERARPAVALLLALLPAAACAPDVEELSLEVLRQIPHDTLAYTQGLVFHEGSLYESTGRYGQSELRELDARDGRVLRSTPLADEYFGEGLALVGDELVQLTWQEGVVLVWERASLDPLRSVEIGTHGWGLCHDGEHLYMTTGGSILFLRDPATLELVGRLQVTAEGARVGKVNELECVGEHLWANVYQTNEILKIEKVTGRVVARLDASALVPPGLAGDLDAVLNGIAYDPSAGSFYLTGKLWPTIFEVRIVPS